MKNQNGSRIYAVVAIVDKNNRVHGGGLMLDESFVLTTAHVVGSFLGREESLPQLEEILDHKFTVYIQSRREKFVAIIDIWEPDNNFAVLKFDSRPKITSLQTSISTSTGLAGHKVTAFGFPKGIDADGEWADTKIKSESGGILRLDSFVFSRQYLGSPVWDDNLDSVVGLLGEYDASGGGIFSVNSMANIAEFWPDLDKYVTHPDGEDDLLADDQSSDNHTDSIAGERIRDQVEWKSDAPSSSDLLEHKPLAGALATRLQRIHDENSQISFLMHLDGPWGSGKSTLLGFLKDELEPEWMIVSFDAWRQARIGPPWWTLLASLREQMERGLRLRERVRLRLAETWFMIRLAGSSYALAFVILLLLSGAIFVVLRPEEISSKSLADLGKAAAAILTALAMLWAGARVASKFLLWGSAKGAHIFEQSNMDPMRNAAQHFGWLLARVGHPSIFFIDDLDRCNEKYVVSLLESIQTLIRDVALDEREGASEYGPHFIVAADGAWLRESFANQYEVFTGAVDEPGRPLSYLFLDKLFQLTIPMPTLNQGLQKGYLRGLLGVEGDGHGEDLKKEEEAVLQLLASNSTDAEVMETFKQASIPVRERITGSVIERLNDPELESDREQHALEDFGILLERNPRSMKRFLNTYSIMVSIQPLQPNSVSLDTLALWTILRLRWPVLAEYLMSSPKAVEYVGKPDNSLNTIPKNLHDIFTSPDLEELVQFQKGGPLTAKLIKDCTATRPDQGEEIN